LWAKLDERKQSHFEVIGLIKYENIAEIDPEGDIYAKCPHVYVRKVSENSFCEGSCQKLVASNRWGQDVYLPANADKIRIKVFPDEFPVPSPPKEVLGPESEGSQKQKQRGEEK
jgi:hypothetical protein